MAVGFRGSPVPRTLQDQHSATADINPRLGKRADCPQDDGRRRLQSEQTGGAIAGQYLKTFMDYPPSQKGGSFGIEQLLEKVEASMNPGGK